VLELVLETLYGAADSEVGGLNSLMGFCWHIPRLKVLSSQPLLSPLRGLWY
jgi:hypothetical protein